MLHIFVGMTQRKILCIHRNAALIRREPQVLHFILHFLSHLLNTYTELTHFMLYIPICETQRLHGVPFFSPQKTEF